MCQGVKKAMSISVKNLKYVYSENGPFERTALNNISFEINDGEFVGIIGHTGSGKSTLIEHLNGLLKPTEGNIIIDGEDITAKDCDLRKLRAKVGLVFQYPEYQLFEETVYKDIAYGPGNLGLSDTEINRRVHEAMSFVGLDENLLDKSPFDLSGGQKRRVAIAGVIAMNPSVLILDEPTAGLDPAGRNELLSRLKLLHEVKNTTIILVSHSMEEIARTVNKVMVLSKGSLVAYDTVSEIFEDNLFLESIGLDVPQICTLTHKLNDMGINIPKNMYNTEEVADAIYSIIKGAQNV